MRHPAIEENRTVQKVLINAAGCPGSGFWYPGIVATSTLPFFLNFQALTFDLQLPIPTRYSFSAKSSQYYRILLTSYY
jgi:hypothetical protein